MEALATTPSMLLISEQLVEKCASVSSAMRSEDARRRHELEQVGLCSTNPVHRISVPGALCFADATELNAELRSADALRYHLYEALEPSPY